MEQPKKHRYAMRLLFLGFQLNAVEGARDVEREGAGLAGFGLVLLGDYVKSTFSHFDCRILPKYAIRRPRPLAEVRCRGVRACFITRLGVWRCAFSYQRAVEPFKDQHTGYFGSVRVLRAFLFDCVER